MSMEWSVDLEEEYDKIYRYCYRKLRSREAAEDVTQETFLRYFHTAPDCRGRTLPWLYTVARNLCMDELRRPGTEALLEESGMAGPADGMGEADRVLERLTMERALGILSEQEREMIFLRYVNETPLAVLGSLYGISRFAVHRRLQKALWRMRREMDGEEVNFPGS